MATKEFDEAYGRLNKAQKEAVDTIDGPVMVIAGPGTGKTNILTLRIANIIKQTDTPPNGILALTFSDSGQKAMRLKLREIVGKRADEVGVFTFHGFAAAIIAEFQDHFPHLSRTKQMTEIEAESFVREILRDNKFAKLRPIGELDFYVDKSIRAISDAGKDAWTPEIVKKYAEERIDLINHDESFISSRGATKGKLKAEALKEIEKCERTILFAEVYELYEKKKQAEKRIDFDDLIFELLSALNHDELLLRLIQEKYLYILVDEHQDTNDSQNQIIKKIADFFDNPNLFVVGDEKQAIYRFQGASVQNFLQFQNIWPAMKVISLEENYRSPQGILDASFSMVENNYGEGEHTNLRIKLKSAKSDEPEPVTVVKAGNTEAGEEYLVSEINEIVAKDKKATVAVIVRKNREVAKILALLEMSGISVSAERGIDIFAHPIGRLYFYLLDFLADSSKVESLAQTLVYGLWNLNLADSTGLIKKIRSGNLGELEKDLPGLLELKKEITKAGAIEYLILIGQISGFTKLVSGSPVSTEVWRSIVAMASDLAENKMIQDPRELIAELLSYQKTAEKKNLKIYAGTSNAQVRIMTAHGSKGLEYDYVFLPYCTEESWMSKNRGSYFVFPREKETGDEIRDARRLFYVALTRAKKQVTLISEAVDGLGKVLTPLRFISELDQENIARVELPASLGAKIKESPVSSEIKRRLEFVEYAKNSLLNNGLSVTALNHFCQCPSQFLFKSILKLPEPPAGSAEKGNAMHEALASVWALVDKNENNIAETIEQVVRNYFYRSLLPAHEKATIVDKLLLDAPKVASALSSHFQQSGKVWAEKWTETYLTGNYDGKSVEIRLHGKLDAVIEMPAKVLVYDYKTKKAMGAKEIKGETKNSDGAYFRQLIFYKILLAKNLSYQGKVIEPALVFVEPDDKGRCPTIMVEIEKTDTDRVKTEIQKLIDGVWSGQIFSKTCGEPKCEFCRMMETIN